MYPLSPMFTCFCVRFVSYDVTMTSFPWPPPCKLGKVDIIIVPVYQKSFGIAYIDAIYVFLVSHCYT